MKEKYPLRLLISEDVLQEKILGISEHIQIHYKNKEIVILMIMKGSLCFVADLIRTLPYDLFTLESISCSSYGLGGVQRGALRVNGLESLDLKGKNVLLVDDIFDSGETLKTVVEHIKEKNVADIKTLVLLKKTCSRKHEFAPDWAVIEIENEFVVGYGLDYKEYYRGLRDLYILEQSL